MSERVVCRALLLTPDAEVLLMRIREWTSGWTAWITPGGGRREGETPEETIRRELFEETGLTDFAVGPRVWTRDHSDTWEGRPFRQIESFYLVRTPRFSPTTEHQTDAVEIRAFQGYRWWPLEELEGSDDLFVPGRLAPLLRDLVENGPPPSPVNAGV